MAAHELEVDDAIWERWTASLPAGTSPDRRISDLLIADLEGRVGDDGAKAGRPGQPPYDCPLCAETFDDLDDRDRHIAEDHGLAPI